MSAETMAAPGMHSRVSEPQDALFLRALFASHCTHLHALGLPPAALQALIDQQYACRQADYGRRFPEARALIALVGEEPVGAMVIHDDGTVLHIVDIAVASPARGRGHGRALVRQAQAQAYEARRQAVTLSADPMNQTALRLYLALGFEPTDQQPLQWRMRWRSGTCLRPRAAQQDAHADSLSVTTTTKG